MPAKFMAYRAFKVHKIANKLFVHEIARFGAANVFRTRKIQSFVREKHKFLWFHGVIFYFLNCPSTNVT